MSTQTARLSGLSTQERIQTLPYAVETQIFENLITKDVLAKLLSLSVSYIDKLVKAKKIPHYKIGRSIRFRVVEVTDWLRKRRLP